MKTSTPRTRSPRAPLISLKEAVDRIEKIYAIEGRHPASADIVAQHLGYKSSENGAAKRILAGLGYFGLLERHSVGMLGVTKSFEEFKFAPSNKLRAEILQKWLTTPGIFGELREKFQGKLPSDASLKFELIQRGFKPAAAEECLSAFVESVQYVTQVQPETPDVEENVEETLNTEKDTDAEESIKSGSELLVTKSQSNEHKARTNTLAQDIDENEISDRIPVRLAGGRRAWLVIPSPFFTADKRRLISQIELLLTNDEE